MSAEAIAKFFATHCIHSRWEGEPLDGRPNPQGRYIHSIQPRDELRLRNNAELVERDVALWAAALRTAGLAS